MTRHGLKPWQVEQAQRYLPPDRARERARRGYELASAVLAGEVPLPAAPVEPVDLRPELRRAGVEPVDLVDPAAPSGPPPWAGESTACRVCYRPHEAPPNTICDRCDDAGRRS